VQLFACGDYKFEIIDTSLPALFVTGFDPVENLLLPGKYAGGLPTKVADILRRSAADWWLKETECKRCRLRNNTVDIAEYNLSNQSF
jgi:hypothetical protein